MIGFLIGSLFTVPSISETTMEMDSIPLWVADPLFYEIQQTEIFPLPDLTTGDVLSFDRAMVVWDVKFQNQILPMFSIIDNGRFSNVSILDPSLTSYWQNFASEILFVGTTFETTFFRWISPDHISFTAEFPGFTQNHSAYFNPIEAVWEISFRNSTGAYSATWDGFSMSIKRSDTLTIDSWQVFSLFVYTDNTTYLSTGETNITVPFSSKKLEMFSLGIIDNFPFVDVAVYDFETNAYFRIADNTTTQLPNVDIAAVYRNVFPSTYFGTFSNDIYSINGSQWIDTIEISSTPSSIGSLTPTLKIATFLLDGVYYRFYGSDFDGDLLPDEIEVAFQSSPISPDTDEDGLSDLFEYAYDFNPSMNDASLDPDEDGLTNLEEFHLKLDPTRSDSDWGGASDGWEVENQFDPLYRFDDIEDTDLDGLPNYLENKANTDPRNPDTDSDGLPDAWEYNNGLNPLNPKDATSDFDNDGLPNQAEFRQQRHPYLPDNPFPVGRYILVYFLVFILISPLTYFFLKEKDFQISESKTG